MTPATRAALSAACERGYREAMGDARNRRSVADRWQSAALAVLAEAERLHVYVPVVARAVRRRQERELRRRG